MLCLSREGANQERRDEQLCISEKAPGNHSARIRVSPGTARAVSYIGGIDAWISAPFVNCESSVGTGSRIHSLECCCFSPRAVWGCSTPQATNHA